MAGRGIPIKNAVEVDLLDGMDCELHGYEEGPLLVLHPM